MAKLLLGIDIGTSSSKGVLARPDGTILATAVRPHDLSLPHPGWAEHDARDNLVGRFPGPVRRTGGEARIPLERYASAE